MPTIRSFLSDLSQSLKSNSLDQFVSPKWLYLKSQAVIGNFLAKDNNSNKQLFKLSQNWAELQCIELIEVDVTSCDVDIFLCQKLMRSKYKLPEMYEAKTGSLLRQCTSVDYSNSYNPIFSARLWKTTQKREYKSKKYFFISDGYLYIPIPKGETSVPEIVRLEGYFKNLRDVDVFNSKQGCGSCKEDEVVCKSMLDYDMVIPSYLEDDVKKEVVNQTMNSYGRIPKDELPNLNSNQITTQQKP